MTDCYFEKRDWRLCKDEVLYAPIAPDLCGHAKPSSICISNL